MQTSNRKEELSISYMMAVCAQAGIDYERMIHDDDSTDGILKKEIELPNGLHYISELRVQLKATSSPSQYNLHDCDITYALKVKNYNELRQRGTSPIILCLLILPETESEWIHWSERELLLKGCMYWKDLSGEPLLDNKSSVTVSIGKENVVNVESLNRILMAIAVEEWP